MWDGVGLVKMPIYVIKAVKINHQVFLSISYLPVSGRNGPLQVIKNMQIMMQQEGTQQHLFRNLHCIRLPTTVSQVAFTDVTR